MCELKCKVTGFLLSALHIKVTVCVVIPNVFVKVNFKNLNTLDILFSVNIRKQKCHFYNKIHKQRNKRMI